MVVTIFYFLRDLHIIFHTGYTNLQAHQQPTRVPFSLCPCQRLFFFVFMITVILFYQVSGDISLWLWFAFDDWLYSAPFCVPVDHFYVIFWEMSIQFLHPFLKLGYMFFFFFAIELFGSLKYFWILTLIKRVDLQKFSFPWVVPSFCWLLPLLCRSFFVWRNPIYLFCFCCLCFWDYIGEKKNQYPDKCQDFPCVFSS